MGGFGGTRGKEGKKHNRNEKKKQGSKKRRRRNDTKTTHSNQSSSQSEKQQKIKQKHKQKQNKNKTKQGRSSKTQELQGPPPQRKIKNKKIDSKEMFASASQMKLMRKKIHREGNNRKRQKIKQPSSCHASSYDRKEGREEFHVGTRNESEFLCQHGGM